MPVRELIQREIERTFTFDPEPLPTSTPPDPFGIDDPCPLNQGGPHQFTASCGEVVCIHCAKVVWT